MPFIFKGYKDISEYYQFESVLIVPCRFCPAASSAVRNNETYIKLFRRFMKTDSYERYVESLKSGLEKKGIRTDVFRSRLIHQFVLCMWTSGRRKKLMKYAKKYDAMIVLGCEAAMQTVRDSIGSSSCRVIQGMESEGVMSIQPRFSLTGNITLELESITPFSPRETQPVGIGAHRLVKEE
ncbi:MAG: hypothetical protein JSW64_08260 [Candidatus Zixiibacteriota bacterium]|nr:MAG: hypothetical protein JSW64_08260 [candidate division Zixibacteria bacterium]